MVDILLLYTILEVSFLILALILTLIYSISILFIRRFCHRNNMLTLNICCTILSSSIYFIIYCTMAYIDNERLNTPDLCIILYYGYCIASIGMPFCFVTFIVHRFCSIVYHMKPFFKTKTWIIICITGQWISEFILALPFVLRPGPYCAIPLWLRIYTVSIITIVPVFINIILNTFIFIHVRASARRVQPNALATVTNVNSNIQQLRISRREISLLRQMIFLFLTFIIGWSSMYFTLVINQFIYVDRFVYESMVLVCEISLLSLIINLFLRNHKLRQYLLNKIRFCFAY